MDISSLHSNPYLSLDQKTKLSGIMSRHRLSELPPVCVEMIEEFLMNPTDYNMEFSDIDNRISKLEDPTSTYWEMKSIAQEAIEEAKLDISDVKHAAKKLKDLEETVYTSRDLIDQLLNQFKAVDKAVSEIYEYLQTARKINLRSESNEEKITELSDKLQKSIKINLRNLAEKK